MKTDIEISNEAKKLDIKKIAKKLNIGNRYLECYGKNKAKIDLSIMKKIESNPTGKLILVTSTNPTPYGEGKTTMSIGINDAMNQLMTNLSNNIGIVEDAVLPYVGEIANETAIFIPAMKNSSGQWCANSVMSKRSLVIRVIS